MVSGGKQKLRNMAFGQCAIFLWITMILHGVIDYRTMAQYINTVGPLQICQAEELSAECGAGQVVVIQSALYGRMHIGNCVAVDYGSIGCNVNVTDILRQRCSGRLNCRVRIPDSELDNQVSPCPSEFKTYLEVTYSCFQVAWVDDYESCPPLANRTLSSGAGYISNSLSLISEVGGYTCPWRVVADPGQTLLFTLLDFTMPLAQHTSSSICYQYALIREEQPTLNSVQVCGGATRSRPVFTSHSHVVDIRILSTAQEQIENSIYFMIKYEAVGCPILPAPVGGWVEQDGRVALMHCNNSDTTWRLDCHFTTWQGYYTNCTTANDISGSSGDDTRVIIWGDVALPYSVCIALILGLAVIVATVILLLGLVCLEWRKIRDRHRREASPEVQTPRDSVFVFGPGEDGEFSCRTVSNTLPGKAHHYSYANNMCSWPRTKQGSLDQGRNYDRNCYAPGLWAQPDSAPSSEHIYESPASTHYAERQEGTSYFELERGRSMSSHPSDAAMYTRQYRGSLSTQSEDQGRL